MTKQKKFSRADYIQALCGGEAWSITPEWAHTLKNWALPEHFDPQAIVTQAGEQFGTGMSRTTTRDGVGIMQIRGPLFTHENFLSYFFGFDTYESLAADFQNLMNDPTVRGIVLNFHSPGGMTAGVADLASMIFDARGIKPQGIVARAGGDMASAAYWLGSAADKVHVAQTGIVGSIGTVVQFTSDEPGTVTIVSDQSPNKRPDLGTPEGQASIKSLLNSLSDVFISQVARNRGVSVETVQNDFGRGGVLVGQAAVDIGMADAVSTFESTFSTVRNTTQEKTMTTPTAQAPAAVPQSTAPAVVAEAQTAPGVSAESAVQAERARVSGILAVFAGTSFAADAGAYIADGKTVAEAQAHAIEQFKKTPAAPSASSIPSRSVLASEGAQASAASASAPAGGDPAPEASSIKLAMTRGANTYREGLSGNIKPTK